MARVDGFTRLVRVPGCGQVKGPHIMIGGTAGLMPIADDITALLARGDRP